MKSKPAAPRCRLPRPLSATAAAAAARCYSGQQLPSRRCFLPDPEHSWDGAGGDSGAPSRRVTVRTSRLEGMHSTSSGDWPIAARVLPPVARRAALLACPTAAAAPAAGRAITLNGKLPSMGTIGMKLLPVSEVRQESPAAGALANACGASRWHTPAVA